MHLLNFAFVIFLFHFPLIPLFSALSVEVADDDRKEAQQKVHQYHECLRRREKRIHVEERKKSKLASAEEEEEEEEEEDFDDDLIEKEEVTPTTMLRNEGEDISLECDVCRSPTGRDEWVVNLLLVL